jgi:hypothetical protein
MAISDKHIFVSGLLKGTNCKIINSVGMRKLKSGATAKLSMATGTSHGHYDRLKLEILDVNHGKLDVRTFIFNEVLQHDKTNNHPSRSLRATLEVVDHCGWEWYINTPTKASIKTMIDDINDYLEFFE